VHCSSLDCGYVVVYLAVSMTVRTWCITALTVTELSVPREESKARTEHDYSTGMSHGWSHDRSLNSHPVSLLYYVVHSTEHKLII